MVRLVSQCERCYCGKLVFISAALLALTLPVILGEPLIWLDEDTEIVQATPDLELTDGPRWKRQFPGFQPPNFPAIPGWPAGIFGGGIFGQRPTVRPVVAPAKPGHCKTNLGEDGICKTMRQCYPVLYYSHDSEDLTKVRNPALLELYRAASTPCQGPSVINHLYFRTDAEVRQNMVCCAQKKPWTPPSGIRLTTTTTTRRPTFPGWRPRPVSPVQGGPGGHRPPTKRPLFSTTTARPTTSNNRRTTYNTPPPTTTTTATTTTTTTKPFIESSCGQSLIVGGSEVPLQQTGPGMYPWMASMVVGRRHVCGGSLIDSRHVLTAAHCVAFMQPHDVAQIRVLLGDHDLSTVSETQHVVKRVKSLARHRGFTQATLHHDIALLILDSDVVTSHLTNIRPICLTNDTHRYDLGQTEGVVAGWGSTQFQGNPVSVLRHVNMRIWTNAECRNRYGSLAKGGISEGQVCAGSPGRDACRGDSGGPLMVRQGPTYEQVGLVSWGIECGTYPGVYTRVDKYRDWIEKNRHRS